MTGQSSRAGDQVDFDFVAMLHPRIEARLRVNADSGTLLVVPHLCERDGEIALGRLAEIGHVEEAFVFVPEECLWVEVGSNQTGASVQVDRAAVERLIQKFRHVILYHTHPGAPDGSASLFPAYRDLVGAVLIVGPHILEQDVSIRFRAVTSVGVIDYAYDPTPLTRDRLARIIATGLGAYAGENLAMLYSPSALGKPYYSAVARCEAESTGSSSERMRACLPMTVGEFSLGFRQLGSVR